MPSEDRYSFRPGSVALTRVQWSIVLVALIVALVGVGLAFVSLALGGALMGLGGMINGVVLLNAASRHSGG